MSSTIDRRSSRRIRRRVSVAGLALAALGSGIVAAPAGAASGSADLSLTVTHSPSAPLSGDQLTFTVVATNDGPDAAADTVVGLASNWAFQYKSSTGATSCAQGGESGAVICAVGSIPSGGSATVAIVVTAASSGVFPVPAAVSSETPDPDVADRATTDTVIVRPGPSQIERALGGVYQQVLGRAPSTAESAYWAERWNSSAYDQRSRVPLAIISGSESRRIRIKAAYTRILGRSAGAGDVTYWSTKLGQGLTFESFEANLIGSAEFRRGHGPGTGATISAAFSQVLGRAPNGPEASAAASAVAGGTTIGQLAASLQRSTEARNRVIRQRIQQVFERTATNFDRFVWLNALNRGSTHDAQWAELYASGEYLSRFPYGYYYAIPVNG